MKFVPRGRALPAARPARLASLLLAALAAGHLLLLLPDVASTDYRSALAAFLGVAAVLTAAKLWRDNCFESRLVATVLAAATVVGQALAVTVGPPGGSPAGGWTTTRALLLVLAVAVPALLAMDPAREAARREGDRPYAL